MVNRLYNCHSTAMPISESIIDDKAYWDAFYKSNPPINYPSDFAESIIMHLQKGKSIVDLGCGNGRDCRLFIQQELNVMGIDGSGTAINMLKNEYATWQGADFLCGDFTCSSQLYNRTYDYFYSRFSMHAITAEQQHELLENAFTSLNADGIFFIEVRSVHDELYGKGKEAGRNAYIYDGHYRRFIINDELIDDLSVVGFDIIYNEESRGFAKFGDNDPIVIRVIASKR